MSRLYLRLLLWFCVANLVTMLISVFLTERMARHAYGSDPDWQQYAQQANDAYIKDGQRGLLEWMEDNRRRGLDATLFEGQRNLSGRRLPLPRILPELLESDSVEFRPRPDMRVVGQRVIGRDGVARHLIAVRRPGPPPRIEELLSVQIGLSLLAIGIVGWWLARSIARPVAAVREAARRFASGDLAARVPERWTRSGDEVGDLARDFDRMAMRIETLVTSERGVLQDVSHELRSPLARLHLLLDLAQRSPPAEAAQHFDRAEQEISRLDELIGQALALSRLESDLPGSDRLPVDLADLLQSRVEDWKLEADARGVTLQLAEPPALTVTGSQTLIARAIDNLLANAIKFSADGGRVDVELSQVGGDAQIRVRDYGPGVPAEDLPRLFRPFFRGSNAALADGHGLGLAIVNRVVTGHRGSVQAANADGGGLEVRLRLPV